MGHRSPPVVANGIVVVATAATAVAVAVVKQATVLGPYTPSVTPPSPLWHQRQGKFFDYALVKVASFVAFVAFVSFVHAKNKSHMFHQAASAGS